MQIKKKDLAYYEAECPMKAHTMTQAVFGHYTTGWGDGSNALKWF